MVTRITPVFIADGTGRDTYIVLDQDFKNGFRQPPAEFMFDLRSDKPRGAHARGYQRWFTPSKRTTVFAPKVPGPVAQLPSKAASRSASAPRPAPRAVTQAWTAASSRKRAWRCFERLRPTTSP
mmetsp:Transcript_62564/g.146782  ORF Transcript_62564/g.146782 Transcript_62564/m.146782 type:complete len:124 (-) Transcript_62564:234-605(-)